MTKNDIQVMLADDHNIFREGLHALLSQEKDIKVVAGVSNGRDAVKGASRHKPDVIIMDIGMPDLNGIDATHQIVSGSSKTRSM